MNHQVLPVFTVSTVRSLYQRYKAIPIIGTACCALISLNFKPLTSGQHIKLSCVYQPLDQKRFSRAYAIQPHSLAT